VKAVRLVELQEDSTAQYGITSRLTVNARAAGPRLGKQVQQVIKAAREGDWSEADGVVTVGGIELVAGEYDLVLETAQADGDSSTALALLPGGGFVLLDTVTTPELEAEGLARDIIRAVQDTRKAAGLDVSDRIELSLSFESPEDGAAVESAAAAVDIAAETLAELVGIAAGGVAETSAEGEFRKEFAAGQFANAGAFTVGVAKAEVTVR
jgi:isoleucyl-tRNA synthetase